MSDLHQRHYPATIESGGALAGVREVLVGVQWVAFVIALLLLAFGMLAFAVPVAFAGLFVRLVLWLSSGLARALASRTRATIRVENDALVVDRAPARQRVVPLRALHSGRVLRVGAMNRPARLVLRADWGRRIVLHLDAAEDARSLLREMKMSARERPATFSFFFGLRVTVGADGILMEWPLLSRRRFVPYSKIVSMIPSPGMIIFRLQGGDRYEIMTTTSRRSVTLEHHDALVERIEDACAAYRADNAELPLAALERGGRSALGWVKDLRALSETSGSGYRAATLPSDALWGVALDPTASEEMRIGAGLALRVALDDEGRARLRAAAEASVSPRVRVVLEAAAEGEDDERLGETIAEAGAMRRR